MEHEIINASSYYIYRIEIGRVVLMALISQLYRLMKVLPVKIDDWIKK